MIFDLWTPEGPDLDPFFEYIVVVHYIPLSLFNYQISLSI